MRIEADKVSEKQTTLEEDTAKMKQEEKALAAEVNTLQHTATNLAATHCNTQEHSATHCYALHYTSTHWNAPDSRGKYAATYCNTMQHTAAYCNTL